MCGPGREIRTALILAIRGETVTEIRPSPNLPDPDMIFVFDPAPFHCPPEWDWDPPDRGWMIPLPGREPRARYVLSPSPPC